MMNSSIAAFALVLALGACGGSKAQPDVVDELAALRDQVCGCGALDCFEDTAEKMQALLPRLAQMADGTPVSPEVGARMQRLTAEMLACAQDARTRPIEIKL